MFKQKTIAATEFKAKCLSILDNLDSGGVIITKHGKPIARLLPVSPHGNEQFIGSMKSKIKIKGDLFTTGLDWNAESRHTHRRRTTKRNANRQ